MLIKIQPRGMEIMKDSLSGTEGEYISTFLDEMEYNDVLVYRQTETMYRVIASPDTCYKILYRISTRYDIELM